MKKITFLIIFLLLLISCTGHAILREYKYSYKMKSADDALFDVVTIILDNDMELINEGNTRQSINTTHGVFFVDVVETEWKTTGIKNEAGSDYEFKYRIWIPVEGSMKTADFSSLSDAFDENQEEQTMFSENVVSIESFVRIIENNEYVSKESVPREVFEYLELVPIEISGVLEHVGLSDRSKLRLQTN